MALRVFDEGIALDGTMLRAAEVTVLANEGVSPHLEGEGLITFLQFIIFFTILMDESINEIEFLL